MISSTFSNILKLNSWGTTPIFILAWEKWVSVSMPNTSPAPLVLRNKEQLIHIVVDLPAPLGPNRAKKSPDCTSKEIPLSAWKPSPYVLVRFLMDSAAVIMLLLFIIGHEFRADQARGNYVCH